MATFNFVCLLSEGRISEQPEGELKERRIYWKFMRKRNAALCGELALEEAKDLC